MAVAVVGMTEAAGGVVVRVACRLLLWHWTGPRCANTTHSIACTSVREPASELRCYTWPFITRKAVDCWLLLAAAHNHEDVSTVSTRSTHTAWSGVPGSAPPAHRCTGKRADCGALGRWRYCMPTAKPAG